MKLTAEGVLCGVEQMLRERIAPQLTDDYAANALRMAGSLLAIVRLARDDEVALRVDEHRSLRALFADAAPQVVEHELADQLKAAASATEPGLRISELDRESIHLRGLLIRLHAWAEDQPGEDARKLDHAIWRLLRDVEMPRAPRA